MVIAGQIEPDDRFRAEAGPRVFLSLSEVAGALQACDAPLVENACAARGEYITACASRWHWLAHLHQIYSLTLACTLYADILWSSEYLSNFVMSLLSCEGRIRVSF